MNLGLFQLWNEVGKKKKFMIHFIDMMFPIDVAITMATKCIFLCAYIHAYLHTQSYINTHIQWPQKKSLNNQSEIFFYIDLFTNLDSSVAVSVRWEESKPPCILSVWASHLPAKHSNCHSTRAQRVSSPPNKCIPVCCSTTSLPPPLPVTSSLSFEWYYSGTPEQNGTKKS